LFETVKKVLNSKDEMYGLSTSQKIEYILVKNQGKKLSASQIYDVGQPWDLKTFTPRNSVYARASSLHKTGLIKRDGLLYYV
jgi:sulfur relay (sulfurtransferase) DsrF/TusC family protein